MSDEQNAGQGRLIMFYGTECTHCHEMDPIVKELEEKEGVKIEKLESWHDSTNNALLKKYDNDQCGGVPFFYNEKNGKWICGNCNYDKLKDWAL